MNVCSAACSELFLQSASCCFNLFHLASVSVFSKGAAEAAREEEEVRVAGGKKRQRRKEDKKEAKAITGISGSSKCAKMLALQCEYFYQL